MPRPNGDPADPQTRADIERVRRGDKNAFDAIVLRLQKRLYNLCLIVTRDPDTAEEVAQDAFVRAYQKLGLYDARRPFYPWLATIAVRLAHSRLRKQKREVQAAAEPEASGADPLEAVIATEDRAIWDRVLELPAGERTATFLYYKQDLAVKDVARALGVTAGTVKTLLYRARAKLKRVLTERDVETENEQ